MEALADTLWDIVICGTGLPQSLLALGLSRSDKKILHVDPNDHYGGLEAALSLQEADDWVTKHEARERTIFTAATTNRPPEAVTLSFPRAYSLALAPQLIHASSKLVSQLVSSRAYRQLEFLAVGSFFILKASSSSNARSTLTRIPSTREDVFSSTDVPARAKRQLMKFLKLVLAYEEEEQALQWLDYADKPLSECLGSKLGFDAELQMYIIALTLSLDGNITTRNGLATIHKHLTSMGLFGTGFAAIYPKWGGGSEIAQVGCRAGAVGGGVYMLGTNIKNVKPTTPGDEVEVELTTGVTVRSKMIVRGSEVVPANTPRVSRLVAVVDAPLSSLFEITIEGAPTPAVAVVAVPPSSVEGEGDVASSYPIYAIAHSSDTGECPTGQSVLYLSTIRTADSKALLERSLDSLLAALSTDQTPKCLYQLYYEQASSQSEPSIEGQVFTFPPPSVSLAFDDSTLEPVHQAWKMAMGAAAEDQEAEYMTFPDREGVGDNDDDMYE